MLANQYWIFTKCLVIRAMPKQLWWWNYTCTIHHCKSTVKFQSFIMWCDHSCLTVLLRAHEHLAADGRELTSLVSVHAMRQNQLLFDLLFWASSDLGQDPGSSYVHKNDHITEPNPFNNDRKVEIFRFKKGPKNTCKSK